MSLWISNDSLMSKSQTYTSGHPLHVDALGWILRIGEQGSICTLEEGVGRRKASRREHTGERAAEGSGAPLRFCQVPRGIKTDLVNLLAGWFKWRGSRLR
jgi:hypothetical protein